MSVGEALSAARDARGLSVEDVSRATRIRGQLIRQIEADDFSSCGGAVYARGHIRNIAQALGIDPAPLVADFDAQHGAPVGPAPSEVFERETLAIPNRKGPNWTAAMAVAAAIALVIAVVTLLSPGTGDPADVANSVPDLPSRSASAAPSPTPTEQPSAVANLPRGDGTSVRVRIIGDKSWVRVTDDARRILFQGLLQSGQVRDFQSRGSLHLLLGNAGAVQLVVNGRDLGSPGKPGEVVNLRFSPGDATASG